MDYDADGLTDILTGSYTGQFYLFRGQANGSYAQRELLVNETGATLLMPFDTVYSVTAELVDMDADGDLDLIVGARSGTVQVVTNIGTRKAPIWSKDRSPLKTTAGIEIKGSNAHHADWDGDGLRDLIVGSEHGEVRWYRNTGKNDAPRYAAASVLVRQAGHSRQEEGSTPTAHGQRVKVHVTDWNGDGLVDLLVGDVTWQQSTPNPLNKAEAAKKQKLDRELSSVRSKLASTAKGAARDQLQEQVDSIRKKLRPYNRTKSHTHGWVWLYLRTGKASEASVDRR